MIIEILTNGEAIAGKLIGWTFSGKEGKLYVEIPARRTTFVVRVDTETLKRIREALIVGKEYFAVKN